MESELKENVEKFDENEKDAKKLWGNAKRYKGTGSFDLISAIILFEVTNFYLQC